MVSQKSLNIQEVKESQNETIMEKLVKLQKQIDSLEMSKQYLKVLVVADELRLYHFYASDHDTNYG